MPTTVVEYDKEMVNFLQDVNYGMSKAQFNYLATMVELKLDWFIEVISKSL